MKYLACLCSLLAACLALAPHLAEFFEGYHPPQSAVAVSSAAPASHPRDLEPKDCTSGPFAKVPFATNHAGLSLEGQQALSSLLAQLDQAPCFIDIVSGGTCTAGDVVMDVDGHADERPSQLIGGNQALSEQRAWTVANELLQRSRFEIGRVRGWAATQPAAAPYPDLRSQQQRWRDDRRASVVVRCA